MTEVDPLASNSLAPPSPQPLVPAVFAEKAMASLMQLHGELMDEKERRVDLYRRLMEKEQAVAELRMYVKMLEEKFGVAPHSEGAPAVAHPISAQPTAGTGHDFTTQRSHSGAAEAATPSHPHTRPTTGAARSGATSVLGADGAGRADHVGATQAHAAPRPRATAVPTPKVVELPNRATAQVKHAAPPPPPPAQAVNDGWKAW